MTHAAFLTIMPDHEGERMHKSTTLALALTLAFPVAAQEKPATTDPIVPSTENPWVKIRPTVHPMPKKLQQSEGVVAKAQIQAKAGAQALNAAMLREVEGFDRLMTGRFSIALLSTADPQVRSFIAQGVLKVNPDIYTRMESGLASLYVENSRINGQQRPICYVLNNPERAGHLWRSFVPENKNDEAGIGWAARYLVAHEVGHCLDRWQRSQHTQSASLSAEALSALGIPKVAFDRTFGSGRTVAPKEYQQQQVVLHRDGALLQYQERVADAFAVLWMMGQKAPNEHLKPIWDTRMRVAGHGAHHAHATLPALQKAYAIGMEFKSMPDLNALWDMSRRVQIAAGVDPSLGPNSKLVNADAEKQEAAPGAKPGEISAKGAMPAIIRFDKLPKFGTK